jgi:hypothetical protein
VIDECRALDADGIIGVTLSIRPFPAGGTEFTMQGTAIVSFNRSRETGDESPLTIMRVNPSPVAAGNLREDGAAQAWTQPESEGRFLDRVWSAWSARRASRSIVSNADSAGITKKAD